MPENDDAGDLPDFLDLKKTLPPDEYAARLKRSKDATATKKAAPATPKPVAEKPPAHVAQEERKKEKSRVRVEQMLAKKTGETSKMPATGREALAIIHQAAEGSTTMNTHETTTTTKGKLPVPPPKSKRGVTAPAPKKVDPETAKVVAKAIKTKAAKEAKAPKVKVAKTKTTKAKVAKTAKTKVAANGDGFKPGTKLALIAEMITRKTGATEPEMNKKLGWTACLVTARRVAERMGKELVGEKDDDGGPTTWFAK